MISTIQFNGSNAYELNSGEFITTYPMKTEAFQDIAFAVQVFTATPGAGITATLREIGEGGTLIQERSVSYAPPDLNLWARFETFWPAHASVKKAEIRITGTVGKVLIAQPKVSNGKVTGPYATNFAPQLSKMSPTGIYTGTVVANQVIMSESESLDQALTTMRAGFAEFVKIDDLGTAGRTAIDGANITTGKLQDRLKRNIINLDTGEISFADGMFSFAPQAGASIANFKINSDGLFKESTGTYEMGSWRDFRIITDHLLNRKLIPSSDIPKYDYSGDGNISPLDQVMARDIALGRLSLPRQGKFTAKVDSADPYNILYARAEDLESGRIFETKVGAMRISTPTLETDYARADYVSFGSIETDYAGGTAFGTVGQTTFTTADGKTVTVTNGIITGVANG